MYYTTGIDIDMEYLFDEKVICITDYLSWKDRSMYTIHRGELGDRVTQALDYAFQLRRAGNGGSQNTIPPVRIIFKHKPDTRIFDILNKAKEIFESSNGSLEWEYRPSENNEQQTDDNTNIPDDQ